jgi:hypothetical protein
MAGESRLGRMVKVSTWTVGQRVRVLVGNGSADSGCLKNKPLQTNADRDDIFRLAQIRFQRPSPLYLVDIRMHAALDEFDVLPHDQGCRHCE